MPRQGADVRKVTATLGEVFREHGFSGTSLTEITRRTGLGKGSLYHHFPEGKKQMAEAVLDDVADWFDRNVFIPLRTDPDPLRAVEHMFEAVERYFRSGRRICLVGAFALDDTRDEFARQVNAYFTAWNDALAAALVRHGLDRRTAEDRAEDIVSGIQGALVLSRSLDDAGLFIRALDRFRARVTG